MSEDTRPYVAAPTIRFEDRPLPHQLTFEEREKLGLELAHSIREANRIEAEGKMAAKAFKTQLDAAESKVRAHAAVLNQGYEYRETRCRRILDLAEDTLTVVREDTGELVETRRLNSTERRELEASRQMPLPIRIDAAEDRDNPERHIRPTESAAEYDARMAQLDADADAFAPDSDPAELPDFSDRIADHHRPRRQRSSPICTLDLEAEDRLSGGGEADGE